MDEPPVVKQPAYAGSAIAIVAAACVTGILASQPVQVSVAGVEAVGALLLLGSGLVRRRGYDVVGGVLVVVGYGLVCLALGLSLLAPSGLFERMSFLGGTLATAFVTLGVYPLKRPWAHGFNGFAAVLFSCSLVFLVWVSDPSDIQVLLGIGLTIVAWDMSEYAITLGEDVGRSARTYPVTGVHFIGSLSVGVAAGILALVVSRVALPAVPIATLALLLSALLLLLLVLLLGDSDWLSTS
ncbi:hypothetical protein ELS19_10195 [Halogeometricum borinquense]|uniref:Uncharacterized protein n=1 Tax=Halogeometricum borinquense TaxID=60847 RepID=A0A482T8U7_9EURY|nr:hypothetical protein [Halogeometricum borinquense]RYJ14294.1 hypothetical protein ELS19_10195 [Halogeometricum borinquense]